MAAEHALFRWDDLPLHKVTDMVARKTITGTELAVSQAYFKKGTLVPVHRAETESFVYVLQGALRVRFAGEEMTVREGEVLTMAAGVEHQAESLDDTFLLTVTRVPPPPAP